MAAPAKGKKSVATYKDPKTGRKRKTSYGAKGYSIAPGTKKGDNYCARSSGIPIARNPDGTRKYPKGKSPNELSRKKWKCSGKKSMR